MAFKKATVNASDVAATLSDYPSYVDLSRLGITTLAEAQSVRVYADEAKTTEWAREIVSATEMHVKIPSLTSTTDIYVDYDGVRADYAVGATYGRNAVWSDYVAVMHFDDATNSTGGTTPSATSMTYGAGKIGDAGNGAGSGYVTIADSAALTFTNGYTVQCWSFFNALPTTLYRMIHKENASPSEYSMYGFDGADQKILHTVNGARNAISTSTNTDVNSVWTQFHFVYDRTRARTYLNAVQEASTSYSANLNNNAGALSLFGTSAGGAKWNGKMDEFRARAGGVSANWITTEYNNQNDEATFWGTWTDVGGGATANNSARRQHLMMM